MFKLETLLVKSPLLMIILNISKHEKLLRVVLCICSVGNLVSQLDDSAAKLKGKFPNRTYTYIVIQLLYKVRHLPNVCELAFYLRSIEENHRCVQKLSSFHWMVHF